MPKFVSSSRQRIEAYELLKKSLIIHADGFVEYKEGLSDESIAKSLGIPTHRTVENIRLEMFGKFRSSEASGSKYASLQRQVNCLQSHLDALCISLGYNQTPKV